MATVLVIQIVLFHQSNSVDVQEGEKPEQLSFTHLGGLLTGCVVRGISGIPLTRCTIVTRLHEHTY